MEFLNSNPNRKFRLIKNNDFKLYVYGYLNISDAKLFDILCTNNFPKIVKGQFAFVFLAKEYWIGCVDHLCTTNLYYTDNIISPLFDTIVKNTQKLTQCNIFEEQLKLFHDWTVGPFTKYHEIKRIEHEHYVKNFISYRHSDILNQPICNFDIDQTYELLLNIVSKVNLNKSVLCLSGGKDSAFIAMLLKHLNYNPTLVNIVSKHLRTTVDIDACNLYRKECGWKIHEYEVDKSGPITDDDNVFFQLWRDKTFPSKKHAVKNYLDSICLTGEVSARGGSRIQNIPHYFVNFEQPKIDDLTYYIMNSLINHFHYKPMNSIIDVYNIPKTEGYQYIFEYYRNRLKEMDYPLHEKIWHVSGELRPIWRCWGQSQDTSNNWFNIYTDWDLQNIFYNCPNSIKKDNNMVSKNLLRLIGKNKFKSWSDISWRFPSAGFVINDYRN